MKHALFFLTSLILFFAVQFVFPCTTAIVSGKYTSDGRPLLWKHRDSDFMQNKIMSFNDGKYTYIGLVNCADPAGKEVWAGCNSAGFAIMNAASYNLNPNDTTRLKDQEGILMKKALQQCASLKDFERLLDNRPKPMGIAANFGVIDAQGGAAYYETDNYSFKKIDANDPAVAPFGYLVRTNFSFSGIANSGYGFIRYQTAKALFYQAAAEHQLNAAYILQNIDRSLKHSLIRGDLQTRAGTLPANSECFVPFQDYIPRYSSCSTVVVQGVRSNELPQFTTMWTVLGFPLCSVAMPLWVNNTSRLPRLLRAAQNGKAPLCELALNLKKRCFPVTRGSGKKYLNLSAVWNKDNNGIWQQLRKLEGQIISMSRRKMKSWRQKGLKDKEIQKLYRRLEALILKKYAEL